MYARKNRSGHRGLPTEARQRFGTSQIGSTASTRARRRAVGFFAADDLLRARSDGTVLEIFEWKSAKAADEAHQNPALRALWGRFVKIADFIPLSAIRESDRAFSHFETWGASQPTGQLARKRPPAKRSKR